MRGDAARDRADGRGGTREIGAFGGSFVEGGAEGGARGGLVRVGEHQAVDAARGPGQGAGAKGGGEEAEARGSEDGRHGFVGARAHGTDSPSWKGFAAW